MTQFDIDTCGDGDGTISNTVTADSAETTPGLRDRDRRHVDQKCELDVTKTADVDLVDAAGDVINYTVNVQNTGTSR